MIQVALIRGINVGATKRLKMADLRAALEAEGLDEVRTYLQSGNVVLRSDRPADEVASAVSAACLGAPVMMRTADDLARVVKGNPYPQVEDAKKLHVAFLDGEPELPEGDFAPEAFTLRGAELYVSLPHGMQNSPLVKALSDRALGVAATWRNWNTVRALHEMCSA